jgi:hypothetical protein
LKKVGWIGTHIQSKAFAFSKPLFRGLLTLSGRHQCQKKNENGIDQSHEIEEVIKDDIIVCWPLPPYFKAANV